MFSQRISLLAKSIFLGVGLVLAVATVDAQTQGEVGRKASVRRSDKARSQAAPVALTSPPAVDDHLWSEKRVRAYRESLGCEFPAPLAVLRIPRAGIEVPVLPGTDEATLNHAVAWIEGTAGPGEAGNVGIAGHRDGFFRGLKDVAGGDAVTIVTLEGVQEYVVEDIRIVGPNDISVLAATSAPTLTLVTCYPFYFVGEAPQRYIVKAVRRSCPTEGVSSSR
jgi:sortase A